MAKDKKKIIFRDTKLVNTGKWNFPSLASIAGYIVFHNTEKQKYNTKSKKWVTTKKIEKSVDAQLTITDCSRAITLDLDYSNKGERGNAISKLKVIEDFCREMREKLEKIEL